MNFCVIGIGRFGYNLAVTLAQRGMEVLAVDSDENVIASIKDEVTQAICIEITDEESLHAIGITAMDTVIVAMGENFAQSILITALLKQRLHMPNVIARAGNTVHRDILQVIGADHVVLPEQEIGVRLADKLSVTFSNFIRVTEEYSITFQQAPERFVEKKIADARFQEQYQVICLGKKIDEEIKPLGAEYIIEEGDILVFAGDNKHLERVARFD